jgi:formate dehydrogenase major subunit
MFGKPDKFHVCTTYRLTEHFHYWTKHTLSDQLQPERRDSEEL